MVALLFSTDDQPYSVHPILARNFVHYLGNRPLAPNQAQQFVAFLERQEANLEKVTHAEAVERRRILGEVYSLILSWRDEREKGSSSIKASVVQETKSVSNGAVTIPHGKYLTIAQVAEICAVEEKTISA